MLARGTPALRVDLLETLKVDVRAAAREPPTLEDVRRRTVFAVVPRSLAPPVEDFSWRMKTDPRAHLEATFWCVVLVHKNEAVLRNVLDTVLESERLAMARAGAEFPPLFAVADIVRGEADLPGQPPGTRRVDTDAMVWMLLGLMGGSEGVATAVEDLNAKAPRGAEANALVRPWWVQTGTDSRWCHMQMRLTKDAVDPVTGAIKRGTLGAALEDVHKERPNPCTVQYPQFDSFRKYVVDARLDFLAKFGTGDTCAAAAAESVV